MNTPQIGNIGVITTRDAPDLFEVTGEKNGLLYCLPLSGPRIVAVCMPDHFWVLLEFMP